MKVLSHKYRNPTRAGSSTWTALKKGQRVYLKGIKWMVGSRSNLSFWHDKWLEVGMVRELIIGPIPFNEDQMLVKDVREEER